MIIDIIGIFFFHRKETQIGCSSANQINPDQVIFKRECKSFERKENEPEYGRQGEDFADLDVARGTVDLALCREPLQNAERMLGNSKALVEIC